MRQDDNYWQRMAQRRLGRRTVLGTSAALGALAVTGCGDDDKPKATASPATGATPATGGATSAATTAASPTAPADLSKLSDDEFFKAIPLNAPKTWKDEDIKTGGKLVRGSNRTGHFDFMNTTAGFVWDIAGSAYNRLVRFSARQGMKSVIAPEVEPDMALKWERPDETTLVMTLNPGIKWQNVAPLNGRPLTIDDIKFSFTRGRTSVQSVYKATYSRFESFELVGSDQLRIKLNGPQPLAELFLSQTYMNIMPPEIGENPDTAKQKAVGTGPMIMTSFTPNVSIDWEKNGAYWKKDAQGRAKPYIDGYSLRYIIDPSQMANAFAAGQMDFCYGEGSPIAGGYDGVRDFNKRLPTATLFTIPNSAPPWAVMGKGSHPAWKDARFRRAISMLLPREQIGKSLYKNQFIMSPYYTWPTLFDAPPTAQQLGPNFAYNPKDAKAMLEAAGLLAGPYDLEWYDVSGQTKVVDVLQEEAAKIGMKINLVKNADQASHFGNALQGKYKDFTVYGRGVDFLDPAATMSAFVTGQDRNLFGVNDPQMDEYWQKLASATGDARKNLAKQIWDRQLDQMHDVTLPAANRLNAQHPKIKNFVDTAWSATVFGMGQVDSLWIDPAAKL